MQTYPLTYPCPRCHKPMVLPLPPDVDPHDARRIAKLILCDKCMVERGLKHTESKAVRLPYAGD